MEQAIKRLFGYPLADEYARQILANLNMVNKLSELRWVVFGDSLSQPNTDGLDKYSDLIASRNNMYVKSYARGGCGWFKSNSSNTWGSGNIASQIEEAEADYDIVSIMAGVNELGLVSTKLGSKTDTITATPETLCGAVKKTLEDVIAKYPLSTIFVMLSIPGETLNALTHDGVEPYYNAIKEICGLYNIPCLDLCHTSNLRPWNADNKAKFYRDYIHLNAEGQEYISCIIENFLLTLVEER